MINAKKKGNHGENEFSNYLQSHGFKAWRNSSSGAGINKGDINNQIEIDGIGVNIEVKTVKKINLMKCWRQTNKDASVSHTSPVLAVRFDHMPPREWLITIHSDDFMALLKNQK